jgi:hypothetical protein
MVYEYIRLAITTPQSCGVRSALQFSRVDQQVWREVPPPAGSLINNLTGDGTAAPCFSTPTYDLHESYCLIGLLARASNE